MNSNAPRRIAKLVFSLLFVGVAAWLVLNRQAVIDWWRLAQYKPTAAVAQLAANDTMVGRGKDLFYTSEPEVQDGSAFNQSCSASKGQGEQTIVLGCYKLQRIYVYNVTDSRLNGVKEVTAAHEMLHAAYERLSTSDRNKVNAMLEPIIDTMKDERILNLIKLYNKEEPGQLYNEMHSILGTEYASLTPELENYYKQYFSNRSKVVGYAEAYQAVFTESQNKIEQYDKDLTSMKAQIDQNNTTLNAQQTELQAQSSQLNLLRTSGNLDAYNQAVPDYNSKVDAFNALVEQTKTLISQYNALVETYNAQAAAQDNLYQSLDSSYQPASQN